MSFLFFYKFLHKKMGNDAFPSAEVVAIDKNLVKLNAEEVDRLKGDVESHERTLGLLYQSCSVADELDFREERRRLAIDIHRLYRDIDTFKRRFFSML